MITNLGYLHFDIMQSHAIQQMAGKFCSASGKVLFVLQAVTLEYILHPKLWTHEYDQQQ